MFDPASIAAAASLGGGIASAYGAYMGAGEANKMNLQIARESNAWSANQARKNRNWQAQMSNTAWQRGVADMKKAGINPMLAVSQGGASSPSGNSAQAISNANQQNAVGQGIDAAWEAMSSAAQIKNMAEQNKQIQAQTRLTKAQSKAIEAVQPVKELEGSLGGFGKHLIGLAKSGFHRVESSAFKAARNLGKHDQFGKWNKRTGEILGHPKMRNYRSY